MTDPRTLKPCADLVMANDLRNAGAYAVSRVNEQMLLPTMEVYLSTVISMPMTSRKRISRRSRVRETPAHTIQMWERLS